MILQLLSIFGLTWFVCCVIVTLALCVGVGLSKRDLATAGSFQSKSVSGPILLVDDLRPQKAPCGFALFLAAYVLCLFALTVGIGCALGELFAFSAV